jgi:hypothetical protein
MGLAASTAGPDEGRIDNGAVVRALWEAMRLCHAVPVRSLVPRSAVAVGGGIELILILPV